MLPDVPDAQPFADDPGQALLRQRVIEAGGGKNYLHGVVEFDLREGRVARTVELPVDPAITEADYDFEAPHHGLAISPDERLLCAVGRASDYVALIATDPLRLLTTIEVDDAPGWAATGPDGRHCFVPNTRADTLSVISYGGRREVARLKVGDGPKQIEAGRIPEADVCTPPLVEGCERAPRLVRRCTRRGRLQLGLAGDLDGVYSVTFRAGRVRLASDTAGPFRRTVSARRLARARTRRLVAHVTTAAEPVALRRSLPRCRR